MSLRHQIVNSVGWNTSAVFVNTLVQVLRIAVLARILDASDFGLVAISLAVVSFCEIFSDLGFTVPILHKQDITKEQYSSIFWVNNIISVAIYAILFATAPIIASIYGSPELVSIVRTLGLSIIINSFGKIFQTIRTKELQFRFLSIVSIFSSIIGFCFILLLALNGHGVYSLVYGTLIQITLRQIVYFFKGIKSSTIKFYLNMGEIKDFFKIGGYQICAQLCDFIVAKADVFILGKMVGMEELGFYNLAKELILKCYSLMNSISRSVMTASLAKIQEDIERTRKVFSVYSELFAYLGGVIFLFVFIFSSMISKTMYGESYIEIEPILKVLCFYGLFSTFISPSASLTVARGRTDIVLKWTIVTAVISLSLTTASAIFGLYAIVYTQVLISIIFFGLNWKMITEKLIDVSFYDYTKQYIKSIAIMLTIILICSFDISNIGLQLVCYIIVVITIAMICIQRGFLKYLKR